MRHDSKPNRNHRHEVGGPIRGLINRARGLFSRERGAALTEFTITLPIFVMIFTAIVWMGEAYQKMVEVNVRASLRMWDRATTVQHFRVPTSIPNRSMSAATEAATLHPGGSIAGLARRISKEDMTMSQLKNIPAGAAAANRVNKGTHGESWVYMEPSTQIMPNANPSDVLEEAGQHGKNKHADFAISVINDGPLAANQSSKPSVGSSSALSKLVPSIPSSFDQAKNGFVQAVAANIRWGDAFGYKKENYQAGNLMSLEFEAGFDTMVPPFAPDGNGDLGPGADEFISVGVSRLMAIVPSMHCFPARNPGVQSHSKYANKCKTN